MPINPYEGLQQAAWGGKSLTTNTSGGTGGQRLGGKQNFGTQGIDQANITPTGGRMGGRPEQANTSQANNQGWTKGELKPTPQASSRQNNAAATMGAPDYGGYKTEPAASARKAAFGGNAGNQQRGNGFNITTGDIQIGNNNTARGGRGGVGNQNGDGDGNSVRTGDIDASSMTAGRDAIKGSRATRTPGTAGRRRITPVRRTGGPAGPAPATPAIGAAPAGGAPAGGAPTPVTPAIAGGKAPLALGSGTAVSSPTVATPTGPEAKPTRAEKIAEVASRGSTAGERSAATAAQERISGAPKGPVGKMGSGTDAEQTSNFKGLQGAVSKSATAGGAKEPMNQRGQGSSGMPTAQSTSGGAMANLEKNKAKPSSPTTASAPEPTNASGTKRKPVTGFGKRTIEPAGDGTIGPRSNPDGTEDKTKYTVGLGAQGVDPKKRNVRPAAVQPDPANKGKDLSAQSTIMKGNVYPSTPEGDAMREKDEAKKTPAPVAAKEKVKTAAKKKVEKAVSKPPTNASAKKKSKGPVGKMGGGTDAEQTSNFKGLQGAVKKSAKKEEK